MPRLLSSSAAQTSSTCFHYQDVLRCPRSSHGYQQKWGFQSLTRCSLTFPVNWSLELGQLYESPYSARSRVCWVCECAGCTHGNCTPGPSLRCPQALHSPYHTEKMACLRKQPLHKSDSRTSFESGLQSFVFSFSFSKAAEQGTRFRELRKFCQFLAHKTDSKWEALLVILK